MVQVIPRVLGCAAALLVPAVGCGTGTDDRGNPAPTSGAGGSIPMEGGRGGSRNGAGAGGTTPSGAGSSAGGMSGSPGTAGRAAGGTPAGGRAGSGGASAGTSGSSPSGGTTAGGAGGGAAGTSSGAGGGTSGAGGGTSAPTKTFVYIGTGDFGKTGGGKVRGYALDESSLALSSVENAAAGALISALAITPDGQALYAGDESGSEVRAFTIDRSSGKLAPLNSKMSAGAPVYLSVDRSGKFLLAAYYNQGSLEVFGLETDRRVGASAQTLQSGAQAHSIVLSADNAFAFAPHKGSNYVAQFKFDAATGKLSANTPANLPVSGGPRHITFHPSKPFAYLMNELDSTLHAFAYDTAKGTLSEVDSKSTLPSGSSGNSAGADVRVESSGNFVYASNRNGANSTLAIFSIDGTSGKLTSVGHAATHGNTPRQFAIHPNGRIVIVANQDSNNLATFRLDPATGMLTFVATTDVGDKVWSVVFLTVPR